MDCFIYYVGENKYDDDGYDLLMTNVFQSQLTVMDFPVFKAIQPDVSCSMDSVLRLIIEPDDFCRYCHSLVYTVGYGAC